MGKPRIIVNTEWKRLIKSNNLTNQQIADMLEVDKSTVGTWLNGKYIPNPLHLKALCAFMHIDTKKGLAMFERDHELYVSAKSGELTVSKDLPLEIHGIDEPMGILEDTPVIDTSEDINKPIHKVTVFKPSKGNNPRITVKHMNPLKQLFGDLVDADIDLDTICIVLSVYKQCSEDMLATLDMLYLKVSAPEYRQLCKILESNIKQ